MTKPSPSEHAQYVRNLFSRIAVRYDLMNRLMTGGQDVRWRKEVIHRAGPKAGHALLDIGAGTGDLAREAERQEPGVRVFAADFTLEMMQVGRQRSAFNDWLAADALHLPFSEAAFDTVISGFLVRNVASIEQALCEQFRVLKAGGRVVILDTTRPKRNLLSPLIWIHMHIIIPLVGSLISGRRDAYTYLPESTEQFLSAEVLAARMSAAGFRNVAFQRRMFGTIAIHWGEK